MSENSSDVVTEEILTKISSSGPSSVLVNHGPETPLDVLDEQRAQVPIQENAVETHLDLDRTFDPSGSNSMLEKRVETSDSQEGPLVVTPPTVIEDNGHSISSTSSLVKLLETRNWRGRFPEEARWHVTRDSSSLSGSNDNGGEGVSMGDCTLYPENVEQLITWYENLVEQNTVLTTCLRRLYLLVLPLCFSKKGLDNNNAFDASLTQAQEDALRCGAFQSSQHLKEHISSKSIADKSVACATRLDTADTNSSSIPRKEKEMVSNSRSQVKAKVVVAGSVIRVCSHQASNANTDGVVHAAVVKGSVKPSGATTTSSSPAGANTAVNAPPSWNESSRAPAYVQKDEPVVFTAFQDIVSALESETIQAMQEYIKQKELDSLFVSERLKRYDTVLSQKEDELDLWQSAYNDLLHTLLSLGVDVARSSEISEKEHDNDGISHSLHAHSNKIFNLLSLIHKKDEYSHFTTLQLQSLQYEYARMKELSKSEKNELSLLQERIKQLEGQIERISAMNMEHMPSPPSSSNPPIDISGFQNQIKDLENQVKDLQNQGKDVQAKLDRRSRQVLEASRQKTALENAVTTLQKEKEDLQKSLRTKTRQLEERELDAARGATGFAVSQSLHQREMELLQFKRAFQERTARYKIETDQWKQRERVYVAAHQRLSQRNVELLRLTLLHEERERQWGEEREKMCSVRNIEMHPESEESQSGVRTTIPSQQRGPSTEANVVVPLSDNENVESLNHTRQEAFCEAGRKNVGMPNMASVPTDKSPHNRDLQGENETPCAVTSPGGDTTNTQPCSEARADEVPTMCQAEWERRWALRLDALEASHRAETKRLRTMIHELQQTLVLYKKKAVNASGNNRESSCQSPVGEPLLWHATSDRCSPELPPHQASTEEDVGSEMTSFALPDTCTAVAIASLQRDFEVQIREKTALQNELSTLKTKYQQTCDEVQRLRQRHNTTQPSGAGPARGAAPPHPGALPSASSGDVKGIQMLLQQTLLEKMDLEERLSLLEKRMESSSS